MVILHTNHGDITLELDAENAPKTVANFLQYVRDGHYDNTLFHRVIDGFMIQGGGFEPGMKQKPTRGAGRERGDQRPQEREVHGGDGAHVAIRIRRPRSSSSTSPTTTSSTTRRPSANGWGYCVFGKVVDGHRRRRQDQGRRRPATAACHQDVPNEDVVIERAEEKA